jgi:beta-galactosidase
LHIDIWGTYITTPSVTPKAASVAVEVTIQNTSNKAPFTVLTEIYSPSGVLAGKAEQAVVSSADSSARVKQAISVSNPKPWSLENPTLYRAKVKIVQNGKVIDETTTPFGIRTIQLDAQTGFTLNGKNIKLKGGCIHHDNGPLGAAAIDRAEERKIVLLKQQGYNAIRSSHYPPSPALLRACDSLGMLVIDEAFDMWEVAKTPQDYHLYFKDWWQKDIQSMLLRDRNHPSIIMWSIGNEIPEVGDSSGYAIGRQLAAAVRRLDATRPITQAIPPFIPLKKGKTWDESAAPSFAEMDVAGYNYNFGKYEGDHKKFPDRIMMATESYPNKALENWNLVEKHRYIIGDFVWTAMDYLGEAAIGHTKLDSKKQFRMYLGWPWFNAYCGDIDLVGNKKPQSYFRDVLWRNKPIAMAVHAPIPDGMVENVSYWGWLEEQQSWTWPGAEGKLLQVRVFSRAPMVRLYLNGKVIGEQTIADSVITAVFQVPYQPGTLKAVNVEAGKETDVVTFMTAGTAKHLRLKADKSTIQNNRNDLSYVMVEVVDDKGQVVPNAEVPIQFAVSGGGEIAGVGSGNPTDVASFQRPERKTWRGKCLVIVRPNGKRGMITLKATADSLTPAQVNIKTH